jgi:WD40 repeat protein
MMTPVGQDRRGSRAGGTPSASVSRQSRSAERGLGERADQLPSTSERHLSPVESMFSCVLSRQRADRIWNRPPPYSKLLRCLSCGSDDGVGTGTILCDAQGAVTSPVFVMKFSSNARYRNMIALGDEEGYVSILRVNDRLPSCLGDPGDPNRPVGQWRAHKNALFDLEWANDDRWMYCASGDTKLSLWDTGYATRIATFHSGRASVKALSVKSDNHHVFASAGRDGDLYVHDVRVKELCDTHGMYDGSMGVQRPVLKLDGPHSMVGTPGKAPKFGYSRSGVTSLCFLKGTHSSILASGGQDGRIKLWDLRYNSDPIVSQQPLADQSEALSEALCVANESRSIHYAGAMRQPPLSQRVRGVTSLSLHPDGTRLLASYIGGQHLIFDVAHPEHGPCQWFGGNLIDSFYVKSAFSPDGTHLISGSSDSNAYIWSLEDKLGTNPVVLPGHSRELTTVAWNPSDRFQIMTAGDDHVVKFWKVDMTAMQEKEERQEYDPYKVMKERTRNLRKYPWNLENNGKNGVTADSTPICRDRPSNPGSDLLYGDGAEDCREGSTQGAANGDSCPTRTPTSVKNILLDESRPSEKRKAARQLTISDALIKRCNKRRSAPP